MMVRTYEAQADRTRSCEWTGLMRRTQDYEGLRRSVVPAGPRRAARLGDSDAMGRVSRAGSRSSSRRERLRKSWTVLLGLVALLHSCQTESNTGGLAVKAELTRLTSELSALKSWFAASNRQPRSLALLSPT